MAMTLFKRLRSLLSGLFQSDPAEALSQPGVSPEERIQNDLFTNMAFEESARVNEIFDTIANDPHLVSVAQRSVGRVLAHLSEEGRVPQAVLGSFLMKLSPENWPLVAPVLTAGAVEGGVSDALACHCAKLPALAANIMAFRPDLEPSLLVGVNQGASDYFRNKRTIGDYGSLCRELEPFPDVLNQLVEHPVAADFAVIDCALPGHPPENLTLEAVPYSGVVVYCPGIAIPGTAADLGIQLLNEACENPEDFRVAHLLNALARLNRSNNVDSASMAGYEHHNLSDKCSACIDQGQLASVQAKGIGFAIRRGAAMISKGEAPVFPVMN